MAVLFGDVAEFGRLSEADVLRFNDAVLGGMAKEMQGFAANLRHIASWGDSIYAVLDDAAAAARLGLHLQEWMAAAHFVPEGAMSPLKLRVAIHFGPVFQGLDGLCGTPTYFGTHVTHAARIEPVTPTGKVYVTEAVAAELKLSDCRDVACDFVGPIPAAKGYGDLLMYVLSRRDDG
jgi:class 3 adenylate cyclase